MKSVLVYKPQEHNLIHGYESHPTLKNVSNPVDNLYVENMDFDNPEEAFGPEHIVLDYPINGAYTTFILPEIERSKGGMHILAASYKSLDGQHRLNVLNADHMEDDE